MPRHSSRSRPAAPARDRAAAPASFPPVEELIPQQDPAADPESVPDVVLAEEVSAVPDFFEEAPEEFPTPAADPVPDQASGASGGGDAELTPLPADQAEDRFAAVVALGAPDPAPPSKPASRKRSAARSSVALPVTKGEHPAPDHSAPTLVPPPLRRKTTFSLPHQLLVQLSYRQSHRYAMTGVKPDLSDLMEVALRRYLATPLEEDDRDD